VRFPEVYSKKSQNIRRQNSKYAIEQEGNNVETKQFGLNDIVEMKKQHPCGTNSWKIIRMGADVRIKCQGCGHSIMIPRNEFAKKMKRVTEQAPKED